MRKTTYFNFNATIKKNQVFSPEDEIRYFQDLKNDWQKSLPRFTDKELLKIFPEAKKVIPRKIRDWEAKRAEIVLVIKEKLLLLTELVKDDFSRWFWREWIKLNEGRELLMIDSHLLRLHRLHSVAKGRVVKGRLTEEQIQQALSVPIEQIVCQHTTLRRSGKNLTGLCPLHKEKRPSFFVYLQTNSCWCFGCQQGGNTINLVRLLYGFTFKEAVKYLIGE